MAEFNISVFQKLKRVFRVWNDVGKNHEICFKKTKLQKYKVVVFKVASIVIFKKKSARTFEHFPCPSGSV